MPRKLTREEVVERVRQINPNVEMRNDIRYVNTHTKAGWRCLVCGHEWEATPDSILRGTGCSDCGHKKVGAKKRMSLDEAKQKLVTINPNIDWLDDIKYEGVSKPQKFHCVVCGNIWTAVPSRLFHDRGCPECGKKKSAAAAAARKFSIDEIERRIHEVNPHVEIVDRSQYVDTVHKLWFRCTVDGCGHVWESTPDRILRGNGCRKCWYKRAGMHEYSDDELLEIAAKYKSKKDFREHEISVYTICWKRGLLEKCWWLKNSSSPRTDNVYVVYSFEFLNFKSVYVGLSCVPLKRQWQHENCIDSPVFRFAKEHGVDVPKMRILNSGLLASEASNEERNQIDVYKKDGWKVLNRAATGEGVSSLGSVGKKWTRKRVFAVARNCKNFRDFCLNYRGAYTYARNHGMLDELGLDKRKPVEYSLELAKVISNKCVDLNEFTKKHPKLYEQCLKNGWMSQLNLKRRYHVYFDLKTVLELIDKSETRKEFRDNYHTAYQWLVRNHLLGILDDAFGVPKQRAKYDYDDAIAKAKSCSSRADFKRRFCGEYHFLLKHGFRSELDCVFPKNECLDATK